MFIERQIFGDSKTCDVGLVCDEPQNLGQLFHCHSASTCAVANKLWIGKISRMEEVFIQYVNIQMYKNSGKTFQKGADFTTGNKFTAIP